MSFDEVLARVAGGGSVAPAELLPYLCLERREQRARANARLAEAYLKSGREENLPHAGVFVRRAWLLRRFSPDLLPLYVEIHAALGDVAAIREAYKRLGMATAARGEVSEALRYFDLWQSAYYTFKRLDRYEYDFDIMECVERLARPHRLAPKPRPDALKGGPARVAYLVKGITEPGSILVKINQLFARHHDRARVEPMFFVPESGRAVLESEVGREHVRLYEEMGYRVGTAPDTGMTDERLRAVARMIADARPDFLVTDAALAEFQHFYVTALRPAPFVVGLVQGPPEQFAPLDLDWSLAWSKHPLIDCPVSCTLIDMELDLPDRDQLVPYDRGELGLPADAFVLATAGRHVKFQEPAVWRAVVDLLEEHPRLHYLAMGVEESQVPFLPAMLTPELRSRVVFLGWRGGDYLRGLCLADVLLDTFPSGGGAVLSDAMGLGVPVVSFRNNYMRRYDQTDWSPAEEFVHHDTIVGRGDFEEMKRVVTRLIVDEPYRREVSRSLQEHIRLTRGDPARAVRRLEDAYVRILEQLTSGGAATDALAAEVESAAYGRRRPPPRWVAGGARQLKRVLRFGVRVLDRVA
jgi:glycosyltransferase involved in cell wall biosynthesis